MIKTINLDDLRVHLSRAKERLSQEKTSLLHLYPLSEKFNREEYAFAYVRAERYGMRAINRRLSEITWLPMQLDPRAEVISENKTSMKRWLTSAITRVPDSDEFGNDFIHSLARCGLSYGWESSEVIRLSTRVANLFRDLSCLIGLIYYCTWLTENNVDGVALTNPEDLGKSAEEIAALIQSPEIYRYLRAQEQNDDKENKKRKAISKPPKKTKPDLRVIKNDKPFDQFMPDPLPV